MRTTTQPSNQLAIPGIGSDGEKLMSDARLWVTRHYDEWSFFCSEAKRDGDATGYISADAITHAMRRRFRVEVKNAYTPAFARIFLEQLSQVERDKYRPCFRLGKSKADLFTEVVL